MTVVQQPEDELLTVDYVALKCNVSDKTVRRWIHEGNLACVLVGPSKRIRIARCELMRMLRPEIPHGQS